MNLKAFIFLTLTPAMALAQAADANISHTWSGAQVFIPTNCDDAAINSPINCGDFRTEGFNALTIDLHYTYSAGTGWEYYLQYCNEGHKATDCTDSTDWVYVPAQAVSSGVATLSQLKVTRAVAANEAMGYVITINYRRMRIYQLAATGSPDSGDKATVRVVLTQVNAL